MNPTPTDPPREITPRPGVPYWIIEHHTGRFALKRLSRLGWSMAPIWDGTAFATLEDARAELALIIYHRCGDPGDYVVCDHIMILEEPEGSGDV